MMTDRPPASINPGDLAFLEKQQEMISSLPHLYAWKWYPWARKFFESRNKVNLLVAANQISKSSTQIRKCIHWATETTLWSKLWKQRPQIFWYMYPDKATATAEYLKKWVPEFLPRGKMKDHAKFGWKAQMQHQQIVAIHFNTGVSVYFKTYAQKGEVLQSSTVSAIFLDEESPAELYSELQFRLTATEGYFHMVFTATLNQDFWRRAMEVRGDQEVLPDAFKQSISMFDCCFYEDGSPGAFTPKRIATIKANCQSEAEYQRRVLGKFITEEGRTYGAFVPERHYCKPFTLNPSYSIYVGVDVGGGGTSHPSAICFVAVNSEHTRAWVVKAWRGDGITTTAGDVVEKYKEMKIELGVRPTQLSYDYSSKDFGTIAQRSGEPFTPAEKNHVIGEGLINTLLKNDMLFLFDEDQEIRKLGNEMLSLLKKTDKSKAHDDACFVAGTLVQTLDGLKPIEEVGANDLVLTRAGYAPVEKTICHDAETIELNFSNGEKLICTPNHPIYSNNNGWVQAEHLMDSDILCTIDEWQNLKQLYLMESNIEDTPKQDSVRIENITSRVDSMLNGEFKHYTKKYGSRLMDPSPKGLLSTIKITTQQIMMHLIWSLKKISNICRSMREKDWQKIQNGMNQVYKKPGKLQKFGTHLKQDANSTKSLEQFLGKEDSFTQRLVRYVNRNIKQNSDKSQPDSALINAGLKTEESKEKIWLKRNVQTATQHSKLIDSLNLKIVQKSALRLVGRKKIGIQKVYNLTVKNIPEYFANGILVHNCDAMRYALARAAFDWSCIKLIDEKEKEWVSKIPVKPMTEKEFVEMQIEDRRGPDRQNRRKKPKEEYQEFYEDIAEWNEAYGS